MRDSLTLKMKMFINTSDVCKQYQDAWSGIVAFNNSFTSFSSKVVRINELNTELQNSSKTTTEQKNLLKRVMAEKTMVIVGSLKAYATVNKSIALQEVAGLTAAKIVNTKDTDADDVCRNVLNKARPMLAELADYATTQIEIDAAQASINDYGDMIGKPKTAILANKSFNEQIQALFKEADLQLAGELDAMMNRFKTSNEVFYKAYHSARRIQSPPSKKEDEETPKGTAEQQPEN